MTSPRTASGRGVVQGRVSPGSKLTRLENLHSLAHFIHSCILVADLWSLSHLKKVSFALIDNPRLLRSCDMQISRDTRGTNICIYIYVDNHHIYIDII